MTDDHTPTTEYVRSEFVERVEHWELVWSEMEDEKLDAAAEFDRWLAADRAEVAAQARADERERIAAAITSRINAETYGTESGVAWVGGWRAAISAAAQAARTPDPNGDNT